MTRWQGDRGGLRRKRRNNVAESAGQIGALNELLSYIGRLVESYRPIADAEDISPREIALELKSMAQSANQDWEHIEPQKRGRILTLAFGALYIAKMVGASGPLYHVVGPLINFRAYRSGALINSEARPALAELIQNRATEKDAIRAAARMQLTNKFFKNTKRTLAAHKAGEFRRYTTEELREKARQARAR
jgi:hypothetical protein